MNLLSFKNIVSILVIVLLISSLNACKQKDPNKQIDEGEVAENIYSSKDIGWQIEIPKGWNIISKDVRDKQDEAGKAMVEQETDIIIDDKGLKHLISFAKNDFNLFASTSEPFELLYEGEYEENNKLLNELIYQTFTNQGLKVDTSSGIETIDNLDFQSFKSIIYGPDGKMIITQELFSRYINGYDLSVNLNYNNDEDRTTMMNAWKASEFIPN